MENIIVVKMNMSKVNHMRLNSGGSKNGEGVPAPCRGKPRKGLNPDEAFLNTPDAAHSIIH